MSSCEEVKVTFPRDLSGQSTRSLQIVKMLESVQTDLRSEWDVHLSFSVRGVSLGDTRPLYPEIESERGGYGLAELQGADRQNVGEAASWFRKRLQAIGLGQEGEQPE